MRRFVRRDHQATYSLLVIAFGVILIDLYLGALAFDSLQGLHPGMSADYGVVMVDLRAQGS